MMKRSPRARPVWTLLHVAAETFDWALARAVVIRAREVPRWPSDGAKRRLSREPLT
jgi:hypothetical protein